MRKTSRPRRKTSRLPRGVRVGSTSALALNARGRAILAPTRSAPSASLVPVHVSLADDQPSWPAFIDRERPRWYGYEAPYMTAQVVAAVAQWFRDKGYPEIAADFAAECAAVAPRPDGLIDTVGHGWMLADVEENGRRGRASRLPRGVRIGSMSALALNARGRAIIGGRVPPPLTPQTTFLPARVSFDDEHEWPAFIDPTRPRWNGFETPYMTPETVAALAKWFRSNAWPGGPSADERADELEALPVRPDGLVDVGELGFAWDLTHDLPATPNTSRGRAIATGGRSRGVEGYLRDRATLLALAREVGARDGSDAVAMYDQDVDEAPSVPDEEIGSIGPGGQQLREQLDEMHERYIGGFFGDPPPSLSEQERRQISARVGLPPTEDPEVLFIDDLEHNVRKAYTEGFDAAVRAASMHPNAGRGRARIYQASTEPIERLVIARDALLAIAEREGRKEGEESDASQDYDTAYMGHSMAFDEVVNEEVERAHRRLITIAEREDLYSWPESELARFARRARLRPYGRHGALSVFDLLEEIREQVKGEFIAAYDARRRELGKGPLAPNLRLYHGTPSGTFEDFSRYEGAMERSAFFTPVRGVAAEYTKELVGYAGHGGRRGTPRVYEVEVDIDPEKIFDIRRADHRGTYEQFRQVADPDDRPSKPQRTPVLDEERRDTGERIELPPWSEGRRLRSLLEPMGFEAVWLGESSQGPSLLVFEPRKHARVAGVHLPNERRGA